MMKFTYFTASAPHLFMSGGPRKIEESIEVIEWCVAHFGPVTKVDVIPAIRRVGDQVLRVSDDTPVNGAWLIDDFDDIWIRDDDHAFEFRMRWC